MRYLKIASTLSRTIKSVRNVPEEWKFVEVIARQYATTDKDLKRFYWAGVDALERFKAQTTEEHYQLKSAWVAKLAIQAEKETY
jgi:hypothetical protein